MKKISIIGIGRVGSIIAYEIARRDICDKLVLMDVRKDVLEGQSLDIFNGLLDKTNTDIVIANSYEDIVDSDVVAITAGKPRTPDIKSRLDLVNFNEKIVKDISNNLKNACSEKTVLVTLTNPMDIMNFLVWKYTGFSRERVIGTGGLLDSMRFRFCISKEFNVNAIDVEAYVIGEHGDNQVPVFSNVKIKNKSMIIEESRRDYFLNAIKDVAKYIIERKGGTEFGPAITTADMIESIVLDKKRVVPCSFVLDGEYGQKDVSIGVPVELGKRGGKVVEWPLDQWEKNRFVHRTSYFVHRERYLERGDLSFQYSNSVPSAIEVRCTNGEP